MSDNQKQPKTCLEARFKNLSPTSSSLASRNKFNPLNKVGEQLESIRKLSESSDVQSSTGGVELNNNSIGGTQEEINYSLRMESNKPQRKSNNDSSTRQSAGGPNMNAAAAADLVGLRLAQQDDLPLSYTSIFAQKPLSNKNRAPLLRKQSDIQLPTSAAERMANKRLSSYSSANNNPQEVGDEEEEEEEEECYDDEDDLDERIPFNSNKLRNKRIAEDSKKSPSPGAFERPAILAFDNKCELAQRHMKISLADCRPPSFNTCQSNLGLNQKQQWHRHQQQQSFTKCDCTNCHKKFSSTVVEGNFGDRRVVHHDSMFRKTYSFHMCLKSIILILLTVLLLMLFFGILMVSHHLPRAIERMMNTPHSFNVTIAG